MLASEFIPLALSKVVLQLWSWAANRACLPTTGVGYDRIVALHRQGAASVARILGIIAAHEIGRLLLGSNAHSPEGIMRPQWQGQDFWRPEPGGTSFSCQQQQKILARMALVRIKEGSGAALDEPRPAGFALEVGPRG